MRQLIWKERISQSDLHATMDRLTCPALADNHGMLLARLIARLLGPVCPVENAPFNATAVQDAEQLLLDTMDHLGVELTPTLEWALEHICSFAPVAVEG